MIALLLTLACAPFATADTVDRSPVPVPAPAVASTLAAAFPAPYDAVRDPADAYADWLRQLPLKPPGAPVRSFEGAEIAIPAARVVDLPIAGYAALQCADQAIRLRALWARSVGLSPVFHYTSGDASRWADWAAGSRPIVRGNDVSWSLTRAPDASDASFDAWLRDVYTYAGTRSLVYDTDPAPGVVPGSLLVTPGSPGHVVVILDVARGDGRTWVLAGQGFMPAMDLHVLPGPDAGWFPVEGERLPSVPIAMPWSALRVWKPLSRPR